MDGRMDGWMVVKKVEEREKGEAGPGSEERQRGEKEERNRYKARRNTIERTPWRGEKVH